MSRIRSLLVTAGTAALMAWATVGTVHAQGSLRGDRAVFFTFSQPVALPNVTLPAGKYLFRLLDSQSNRYVVQVWTGDQMKLLGTLMTIPTIRAEMPENAEIRFMETAAGNPAPVRSWWYPAERTGWEFIYPRQQAMQIAKTVTAPVLTTASDVSGDAVNSAPLARVDAQGQAVPVEGNAPAPAIAGNAQRGEIARDTPPAVADTVSTPAAPRATSQTARAELPRTGSTVPLVAMAGLLALVAAVGLSLGRRVA
jgi:LPXTG-motif cell wall-anchored protein